ncbi:MAG: hypothetical protein NTZ97_05155 [Candidatus Moranbacteria bacterium]|nr:hypothetical protein [Candidatus Moranbacteria bacterium]
MRKNIYFLFFAAILLNLNVETGWGYLRAEDSQKYIDLKSRWQQQNQVKEEWINMVDKAVSLMKDKQAIQIFEYFKRKCILGWLETDGRINALEKSQDEYWIAFVPISKKENEDLFPQNPFIGFFPEFRTLFINTDQQIGDGEKAILLLFYAYSFKLNDDFLKTGKKDTEALADERWKKAKKFLDQIIGLYLRYLKGEKI